MCSESSKGPAIILSLFLIVSIIMTGCSGTSGNKSNETGVSNAVSEVTTRIDETEDSKTNTEDIRTMDIDIKGIRLEVSNTKNINKLDGLGVEWDPHFWMFYNTKHGVDEEDWELINKRVKDMKLQKVRVMVMPEWHEPRNENNDPNNMELDRFKFDSHYMKALKRQLDLTQKQGIKVNLAYWCSNRGANSWLAFRNVKEWCSAPSDLDEFAENVSALLRYLLIDKKYTCIDSISLHNEPNWTFLTDGNKVDFNYYVEMNKKVHQCLIEDGIRDKIKMVVSEDAQDETWYMDTLGSLGEIGDIFSTHNYVYNFYDLNDSIYDWTKRIHTAKEKYSPGSILVSGEFATNEVVDAYHCSDLYDYERGLHLPKFLVNFLNGGAAGAYYWNLFDQYYYDGPSDKAKMSFGLWGFKDEGWEVRPTYHSWALVNKYTRVDSLIYPIISNDNDVCGTCLKSPEGKWTYLLVNTGMEDKEYTVLNQFITDIRLKRYVFSRDTVSKEDTIIAASEETEVSGGRLYGNISAESFIVYTNIEE